MEKKTNKSNFGIDKEAVQQLAQILVETDLSEIEYENSGSRIRVVRQRPTAYSFAGEPQIVHHDRLPQSAGPISEAVSPSKDFSSHPGLVKSPMVGTVYLSPEPGAAAFVKVGEPVEAGQTIMIIEAMKVMNPIKSPRSGKIVQICVNDANPVEFDQPLVVIE